MAGRKAGQGSKWIRPDRRLAIYLRDGHRCAYCGRTETTMTLDHVVPCHLGGENGSDNLVTCCLSCNSSKRALTLRAFLAARRADGHDTTGIARRIRRQTRKSLTSYRADAKALLAARKAA